MRYPTVMTIAGSDSCGGAGIQADIKTISSLGAYACSAITAITSQSTTGVISIQGAKPEIVRDQISAVMDDMTIDAVKSGMLYSKDIVEAIIECLTKYKPKYYVLDPVMVSTSGSRLIEESAIDTIKNGLFPLATIVTPNLPETEVLSGIKISNEDDIKRAAEQILETGCKSVLIKGGHMIGKDCEDLLFLNNGDSISVKNEFIKTTNTHGTGCTLSSAIATELALGLDIKEAYIKAHEYLLGALNYGKDVQQGKGHGPVGHFWNPQKTEIIK